MCADFTWNIYTLVDQMSNKIKMKKKRPHCAHSDK